jgi:RNA polymerase sigma factor (sigma-70 family)
MLEKQFYKRIVEKEVPFSNVTGYDAEPFAQLTADAVYAAARCRSMTGNGVCDEDDHFQNMIVKALEKPDYFNAVSNLRSTVFSTTRNEAINLLKRMRDWSGTGKNVELTRVPLESIEDISAPANDTTEEDELERTQLIHSVLADVRKACKRQMPTESVRLGLDRPRTIKETAKIRGIAERTVTSHRTRVRTYATEHHAESRRQLFGPHHSNKPSRRRRL